jgi:hypothetical protein
MSAPVAVSPQAWSQASKQSVIYDFPPAVYEDSFYECLFCNARSVFTALEQREAFEQRQAYIWQRRTLCDACWSVRRSLERELQDCMAKWKTDRSALQQDRVFLQRWLHLLNVLPAYGRRRNNAIVRMLEIRLEAVAR